MAYSTIFGVECVLTVKLWCVPQCDWGTTMLKSQHVSMSQYQQQMPCMNDIRSGICDQNNWNDRWWAEQSHDPTSKSKDFSSSRLLRTSASFIWSRENPSSPKFFASFRNISACDHITTRHLPNQQFPSHSSIASHLADGYGIRLAINSSWAQHFINIKKRKCNEKHG